MEGTVLKGTGWAALGLVGLALVGGPGLTLSHARPAAADPTMVRVGEPPALPSGAVPVAGAPLPTATVHLDVVLRSRDPAGLAAFDSAVSAPGSPTYHHYLSATAVAARYGPTPASIGAVTSALRGEGLVVGPVSGNGTTIPVTTSLAQASTTFRTPIRDYRLADGSVAFANAAAPSVPAGIATEVSAVLGLDDLSQGVADPIVTPKPRTPPPRSGSFSTPAGPQPCAAARSAATEYGSYTVNQVANAYGFTGLYRSHDLGTGQTVALYENDPFSMSDLDAYASCFGLNPAAVNRQVSVVNVDGGAGAGPGVMEAALDVEVVLSLAPAAHVVVYEGANNSVSGLDVLNRIVSDDRAAVVSISLGLCEGQATAGEPGLLEAEDAIFEQAAAQGQTVLAASGDNGSEDCSQASSSLGSFTSVNDPASQPFVTGVGGTDLTALGSPPSEVAWNEAGAQIGASGGGFSDVWIEPAWQRALVSEGSAVSLCGSKADEACRGVPDVSASADPNRGFTVYTKGAWRAIGGTSAATPVWAALVALTNATRACDGAPVGYLDPRLYQLGQAQYLHGGTRYFNDITSGSNDYTGLAGGLYPAARGWDPATGLGSPVATNGLGPGGGLAAGLCASVVSGRPPGATAPVVSSLSPSSGTDKGGTVVTINGASLAGASAVSFGDVAVSGKAIVSDSATSVTVTAPPAFVGPDTAQPEDGAAQVSVTTPAGTSPPSGASTFTYKGRVPVLRYMTVGGPTSGGTRVSISGSGFTGATRVGFGKAQLAPQSQPGRCQASESGFCVVNDNTISLVSPPASRAGVGAGGVGVVVATPSGNTESGVAITPNQEFFYAPAPRVASLAPSGPPAGGYKVTVSGAAFAAFCGYANPEPGLALCVDSPYGTDLVSGIEVLAGGHSTQVAADQVDVQSYSKLSFTMPPDPGPPGAATVVVKTLAGAASGRFDYSSSTRPAPTLASMTPSVGTANGETPVNITGANFEPGMTVTFGGTPSNDILSVNGAGTSATVLSPGGSPGLAPVDVTTPWGSTSRSDSLIGPNQFTYVATSPAVPTVLDVASDVGSSKGGSRVTISGSGFFAGGSSSAVSSIDFGGVRATDVACSLDTVCQATVPPHQPGRVAVTLTTGAGASALTSSTAGGYDRFTYTGGPGITAISPDRGPEAGGTLVTITGFGFSPSSKVAFGGVAAAKASCLSSTICKAVTAPEAPGTVGVVVTTPGGPSHGAGPGPGSAASQFSFLPPAVTNVAPDQGPTTGGTKVVITGFGFSGASAVSFGKLQAASFSCTSDTTCTAVSPPDPSAPTDMAGQVDVSIVVHGVRSIPVSSDHFTYVRLR
ncbi:MAG: IPT/TIG domain-containing protein [Acidimicrobiales bacterium]